MSRRTDFRRVLALALVLACAATGAGFSAPASNAGSAGLPDPAPAPVPAHPPEAAATVAAGPTATLAPSSVNFTFKKIAVTLRVVPDGSRFFESTDPVSLAIGSQMDANGVAKKLVNGVLYDHPVRQAATAVKMVDGYRLTGDPAYLERAIRNADRLLAKAVRSGTALYFPYPYSFSLHRISTQTLKAPWYSGMAQGEALSAFVRLFEVTGDARWREAADAVFASFTIKGPRTGKPWVVDVDASGYLWLEEYPLRAKPDRTFNGHLYAVFGLYDYWRLTRDGDALLLVRGALATVQAYASAWRLPGGISRYCMAHVVRAPRYHVVHTDQLYAIYHLTGATKWAALADKFLADYPDDAKVRGHAAFGVGTHTGYKFDKAGRVVAHKTVTLVRASGAFAGSRRRVAGQPGVYLAIKDGALAGYLVRERAGIVYIRGIVYRIGWDPARRLDLRAGTYTAVGFSPGGAVSSSMRRTLTATTRVQVDERAIILGRVYFRVVDGPWAGLWLHPIAAMTLH